MTIAACTLDRVPKAPASLYVGEVMHARLNPIGHRFVYRVMSVLLDLDRLDEVDRISVLLRVNRRGLFSFHERDHGPRDGSRLRDHVDKTLGAHGVDIAGGRVMLLAYPRLLGYVFNPLSVYYCYDRGGALAALIYEVRNTFGEIHPYVCPVAAGEVSPAGVRQECDKTFYVSPFIAMAMRYHFRMLPPGESVRVRILETDADGAHFAATFAATRGDCTTRALLAAFAAFPLMTLKVVVAIHYEALRLWLKGAPFFPHPKPEQPARRRLPA
jgi:DUF1365 family protein